MTDHHFDLTAVEVLDAPGTGGNGAFDELAANGADVARHLAEIPHQRVLRIPDGAVALVAGLDAYGD